MFDWTETTVVITPSVDAMAVSDDSHLVDELVAEDDAD